MLAAGADELGPIVIEEESTDAPTNKQNTADVSF